MWGDYQWFHKMVRGGAIGEVTDAWANVGGPSGPCYIEAQETPPDVDWDMWLGPAPWRPFHASDSSSRPFRDYSGGSTTDWGCHTFGGCLFTMNLHLTGPTEIIPPNDEYKNLVFKFASGQTIHHEGGWGGIINFRGSEGEISEKDRDAGMKAPISTFPIIRGRARHISATSCIVFERANSRSGTWRRRIERRPSPIWRTSRTG